MTRKAGLQNEGRDNELVEVGEIVKAHGIRGEVKAYLFSGQPGNFSNYKNIVLQEPAGGGAETYRVLKSREQGKQAILQLDGIVSREAAEGLLGRKVLVRREDFPVLDTGEYYWHQLKGLHVETDAGRKLGRINNLFNTGAHDVMVIAEGGEEYMVPLIGEIVREIDVEGGKVIISAPDGLLEINK